MTEHSALVTGATAGIGWHIAAGLAKGGSSVIVTGRSVQGGEAAVRDIRREAQHERVFFESVDHATVAGNVALARAVAARTDRLDLLINNVAGTPYPHRLLTSEGLEATLATQFVGPAALTTELLPLLQANTPARVINVVSSAHTMWRGDLFDDLDYERDYIGIQAYARAKLLNLMWTLALARRLEASGILANAVNPGMAWTPGTQALTPEYVPAWRRVWPVFRWIQRRGSAEKAARTPVRLAVDDSNLTGAYVDSNGRIARPAPAARNEAVQERVFQLAAQLAERALH